MNCASYKLDEKYYILFFLNKWNEEKTKKIKYMYLKEEWYHRFLPHLLSKSTALLPKSECHIYFIKIYLFCQPLSGMKWKNSFSSSNQKNIIMDRSSQNEKSGDWTICVACDRILNYEIKIEWTKSACEAKRKSKSLSLYLNKFDKIKSSKW